MSDGARYRDCNTEKDVLSGLYLYNLERLIPAQELSSAKLGRSGVMKKGIVKAIVAHFLCNTSMRVMTSQLGDLSYGK